MKTMKKILAIVLLACMVLSFASCSAVGPEKTAEKYVKAMADMDIKKMSKYTAVDSKDLFNAMIEQMMEEGDMSKKEVYEKLSETLEADIDSYNDYCKFMEKKAKEAFEEEYEKKYKVEVSAVASEILEEAEKYSVLKNISDVYDETGIIVSEEINFAKIKECRNVTVKIYIYEKGADYYKEADSVELTMVRIGSKWIVLNDPTSMLGVGIG